MFERFTDQARRVLVLAQEEARLLQRQFIGTEHILLGLIREDEGVAAKVLESLGVSLEAAREKVEQMSGPGRPPAAGSAPFTPGPRRCSSWHCVKLSTSATSYIGTEHILLGLAREGEGVGAKVLVGLGADLPRVRQQVIAIACPATTPRPRTREGRRVAPREARRYRQAAPYLTSSAAT